MEDNRIQTSLFTTLADIKEEVIVSIAGEKASHPSQDTKFSFVKEEVIVSTTSQSSQDTKALPIPPGIHTIEGYVISSIKTHHKFTSADFDAFKEITEPLPIPKFKILGQAASGGVNFCNQYENILITPLFFCNQLAVFL